MSRVLFIDFETRDEGLSEGVGPGWAVDKCRVIGMGYALNDEEPLFEIDADRIREILTNADTLVAHNASYELGILKMLGVDFTNKAIFCTKVGAYLDNNLRESTSLESLAKEIGEVKDQQRFGRFALQKKSTESGKRP
jgi:hypothetical protein